MNKQDERSSFIVGDAGGSGTQWRVVKGGEIKQFETAGFNAYTHKLDDLMASIDQTFGSLIEPGIPKYLYAAGVDTKQQKDELTASLNLFFTKKCHGGE